MLLLCAVFLAGRPPRGLSAHSLSRMVVDNERWCSLPARGPFHDRPISR
jgi:hypothetical protein